MRQIVATVLVLAVLFFGIWLGIKLSPGSRAARMQNTSTVVQQVQTLSDLVTVKYVMEKVVIMEAPPATMLGQFVQGDNRLLMLAHGIVKAGIDLKRLGPGDIKVSGKKISIRLPQPEITDAYLDEKLTKVIDWQRGFLRDYDKDLETKARQDAVDDIRRAARTAGILGDAKERAELQLAAFLHQAGYEEVTFTDGMFGHGLNLQNPNSEAVPKY